MTNIVYLRMKKKIKMKRNARILLRDIAWISAEPYLKSQLGGTPLYQVKEKDKNIVVIDSFSVVDGLSKVFSELEFQQVGPAQTIIVIEKDSKQAVPFLVVTIWLLLFVGAAMTIMNFHYDVAMQEVQQKLHFLLTGESKEYPLWLQIPYSIGLGVGMTLFFNHLFKKRFNDEPSPLEIEMFKYQQDLDSYVIYHENGLEHNDNNRDSN